MSSEPQLVFGQRLEQKRKGSDTIAWNNSLFRWRSSCDVMVFAVTGAASGGFWGLLIGLIFTIPFGGLLVPIVVGAFGASIGAQSGKMSDYGIDDAMMKELSRGLDEGKAALFVLVRKATTDKVLEKLQPFHGKVLQTSFSHELEEKLEQVLDKAVKAA